MTDQKKKKIGCLRIGGVLGIAGLLIFIIFVASLYWTANWYDKGIKAGTGANRIITIRKKVGYFYEDNCKFPHSATSSILPKNWERVVPNYSDEGWKEIKYHSGYKTHFRYRMINEGDQFRIVADSNFKVELNLWGKDPVHTATAILTAGPECTMISTDIRTKNSRE